MKSLLILAVFVVAAAIAAEPSTFRIVFKSYNGDPANPETLDFQLNTLDRKGPTQFYKIGETMEGTDWKFESFEYKSQRNAQGREEDVSVLTLRNNQTKEKLLLPLNKIVSAPIRKPAN